jgi:hypothetical protein
MKKLIALLLLPLTALAQTTVTIPARVITIPQQVITIPAQTLVVSTTTPPVTCVAPQVLTNGVCTTPVVTAPGTFWLFNNGAFAGAGDYSYGSGTVTYGKPPSGVVTVSGDEGWQPRMPGDDFNATGYNFITVSIKPTQAGNTWITGAEMIGDIPFPGCPTAPSIMKYGPNPAVVGVWNTYKIPLSAYCITPALHPYKVMFLEQSSTNKAGNSVAFNALGFVP